MGRCELDSHADTCCFGQNFRVLETTDQVCDVSGYSPKYKVKKDVPIVSACTLYQAPSGECYILRFNQGLWFGEELPYSLINPNQMRLIGMNVQDNPFSNEPLSIRDTLDEICISMDMEGIIVGWTSSCPTDDDMKNYPMIEMTSDTPWNPDTLNDLLMVNTTGHYTRIYQTTNTSAIKTVQHPVYFWT